MIPDVIDLLSLLLEFAKFYVEHSGEVCEVLQKVELCI